MNFKVFDDSELLSRTKTLVTREKEITLEILQYLSEIESRKLFLARGYSSLFEFCVKELCYSEGSANRRISSMRLLKQLPEVEEKIKENKVNLSTLTQLHSHIRREEKSMGTRISKGEKLELLLQIENKSQDDCQRELLKHSSQSLISKERELIISADLTEIRFLAPKERMEKLRRLKNLTANKNFMTDICLEKLDPVKPVISGPSKKENQEASKIILKKQGQANVPALNQHELPDITAAAAKRRVKNLSHYIPRHLKEKIWKRDQGSCQFVDPLTKKKCESQFALQVDHVHPFALGGETSEENLRLLCRAHNVFRSEEIFGRKKSWAQEQQ